MFFTGAGSIGLIIFSIFVLIVFIVGLGITIAGVLTLALTRTKWKGTKKKKVFIAMTVIGAVMVIIPTILFFIVRANNTAVEDMYAPYFDTGERVTYHTEKDDAGNYFTFQYKGTDYDEIVPLNFDGEEFEGYYPDNKLTEEQAVVNFGPKRNLWDILLNEDGAYTAFKVKSNSGKELLTNGYFVFCAKKDRDTVTKYYEDLSNYDYYYEKDDEQMGDEGTRIKFDGIERMDKTKIVKNPRGKGKHIDLVSKDHIFRGSIYLRVHDQKAYVFLEGDEEDESKDKYVELPDSLAKKIIPQLK